MTVKRILLLSGYDAASHRYWHNLLVDKLPEFEWTVLSLPDRHFYWRTRSNALTFYQNHKDTLGQHYDLLIATSMVDLCNLRGFVPKLAVTPTIAYFHENQFDYPLRKNSSNIINSQLTSIFSALCADQILFNSEYNRSGFLHGARDLLERMPDGVDSTCIDILAKKSLLLPVPINTELVTDSRAKKSHKPLEIVWNHRWEYDKQPEVFFDVVEDLMAEGVDFRLHVMGQSFREVPSCFGHARQVLDDKILSWGFQTLAHYHCVLERADIVVSTALHDFQGLGMLEAIYRQCVPVAPNRVAYPEYLPQQLLYTAKTPADWRPSLKSVLKKLLQDAEFLVSARDILKGQAPCDKYLCSYLLPLYRQQIEKHIVS